MILALDQTMMITPEQYFLNGSSDMYSILGKYRDMYTINNIFSRPTICILRQKKTHNHCLVCFATKVRIFVLSKLTFLENYWQMTDKSLLSKTE